MDDITYVFIKGRKEGFEKKIYEARDFYYGCTSFDEKNVNLQVIEFYNEKEIKKLFLKLDYYFSKLLSLPLYFSRTLSFSNFKYSFAVEIIVPRLEYSFDFFANTFGSIFPEESSFSKLLCFVIISLTFCKGIINLIF